MPEARRVGKAQNLRARFARREKSARNWGTRLKKGAGNSGFGLRRRPFIKRRPLPNQFRFGFSVERGGPVASPPAPLLRRFGGA